ncbi:MAG: hypothetical protein ABW121_18905 [Candidatus Thiodiazotropha sp. 6PLUC7]
MGDIQTYSVMNCGSTGVIKDVNPLILPPDAWTFANQVRFDGIEVVQEKPAKSLLEVDYPVQLLVGWNDGQERRLLLSTPKEIYEATHLDHDATKSQVIPKWSADEASPPVKQNEWTGGSFGGIPYFCAGFGQKPLVLMRDDRGGYKDKFEALNHWPDGHSCSVMRHFSNHLIAIKMEVEIKHQDVRDGKVTFRRPFDIMWSDRAQPGHLPKTWLPAEAGSRAGEIALTDGGDEVVDGVTLGNRFCIYKEESIWPIKYVGGNYVFSIGQAIKGVGIMGKNCAVDFNGKNYVFGRDEIFAHDGWQIDRIFEARMNRWIFNRIDDKKRHLCHVFMRPSTREIYFCFPVGDSEFANMAACYHTDRHTVTLKSFQTGINTGSIFEFTGSETFGIRRLFVGSSQGIQEVDVESSLGEFRLEREGIDLGQRRAIDFSHNICLYAEGEGSVSVELTSTLPGGATDHKLINYPLNTPFPGLPIEVAGLTHTLRITNHDATGFKLSGYTIQFSDKGRY